ERPSQQGSLGTFSLCFHRKYARIVARRESKRQSSEAIHPILQKSAAGSESRLGPARGAGGAEILLVFAGLARFGREGLGIKPASGFVGGPEGARDIAGLQLVAATEQRCGSQQENEKRAASDNARADGSSHRPGIIPDPRRWGKPAHLVRSLCR